MDPQGTLSITVYVTPTYTHLLPQNPTNGFHPSLARPWAGPQDTCRTEWAKASRGGSISNVPGCKRPELSSRLGPADASSLGAFRNWSLGVSRPLLHTSPPSSQPTPLSTVPSGWRLAGSGSIFLLTASSSRAGRACCHPKAEPCQAAQSRRQEG